MSEHRATSSGSARASSATADYSRNHVLRFDDIVVAGTAAPGNVPANTRHGPGVDPEQAFVGALSACHMLWFLHLAAQKGWSVERYVDDAVGVLDKTWMSRVTLRPEVTFSGNVSRGRATWRCTTARTRSVSSRTPSRPTSGSSHA